MNLDLKRIINNHADKIRFLIVGCANTAIDYVVLFGLINFCGFSIIISQVCSTSIALCFSFFANKKFTFQDKSIHNSTQLIKFLAITLFGLWVIQTIVIVITKACFGSANIDDNIILFVGKTIATCATLVWNYLLYKKFVFTDTSSKND